MDKLLGHLSQYVLHYVDDILIATNGSLYEHIKNFGQVLEALQEGGIKLRPDKINLATKSLNSLELFGIEEYSIFLNIN
jgi:hypothetical protein